MKLRVSLINLFHGKNKEKGLERQLSTEAIRKIQYKQTMWRVYMHTRKDEDYANYKKALNTATTENKLSKRS